MNITLTKLSAAEFSAFRKNMDKGKANLALRYWKDKNATHLGIYREEQKVREALARNLANAEGNGNYLAARNAALKEARRLGGMLGEIRLETIQLAVDDARRQHRQAGMSQFGNLLHDALHIADIHKS